MNAKKLFVFVLMFVGLVFLDNSEVYAYNEPFVDELPSQQTEQEIQNLSETLYEKDSPQLRSRPTDIPETDRPQKIALGDLGIIELSALVLLLLLYVIARRKKTSVKKLLFGTRVRKGACLSALLFLSFNGLSAQIKAVPDNYFVEPGRTLFFEVLLNDDPGTCSETVTDLDLSLVTPTLPDYATDGVEVILASNQRIRVRTKNTARGQISFKYKIACKYNAALTSEATVYINLAQRPDFIDPATCTIDRPTMVWDIERKAYTTQTVQAYAFLMVGDVDGDGKIEIITSNAYNNLPYYSNIIYVFDSNLNLKSQFSVPSMDVYTLQSMAIADVDPANNDGPEILIGTGGEGSVTYPAPTTRDPYKLYCYHYNKTTGQWYVKWKSTDTYINTLNGKPTDQPMNASVTNISASISVADVDGDGLVEILIGEAVYSGGDKDGLNGGRLLGRLPGSGLAHDAKRGFGRTRLALWCPSYMNSFADIDGDGIQEVVAGNATYKLSLNHDNPALSNITLFKNVSHYDGYTTVGDIDGDGILDVVIVARELYDITSPAMPTYFYVWQGNETSLIGTFLKDGNWPGGGNRSIGSRAFIGDIDGDGYADVAFTSNSYFDALKYNRTTKTFEKLFTVTTTDTSGATTMTMFDFDNDGKVELVYRDETHLRIINNQGANIISFPCYSGTHTEYPVVADVDQDGHADIIVAGSLTNVNPNANQRLQKFGSKTPKTWSPARSVWHQYGYNPTMINEDLSVPRYPMSITTEVINENGTVRRPYNSFLQQAGVLNMQGEFINKAHDLAFLNKNQDLSYNQGTDVLTITGHFTNDGSVDFSGDLLVGFYGYNATAQTYHKIKEQILTAQTVAIYEQKSVQMTIPNFKTNYPTYDRMFMTLNMVESGTNAPKPFYKTQNECIAWNNMTSRFSYVEGKIVACEGESVTLKLDPSESYDCYWYTFDTNGVRTPYPSVGNNKGDSQAVTKSVGTIKDEYLVVVCPKGSTVPISAVPDTAFVYAPMDSLIWTGEIDKDWHNVYNWSTPSDPTGSERYRYIPRACSNVLIPAVNGLGTAISKFPDLSSTGSVYTTYTTPECNNITFDHGGEVVYIDHLTYSKAFINVDMLGNRWYTFAPPLRDFCSGDIYKTSPNPFDDNMEVFTRLYSQTDPEHGSYREGAWGAAFATPTYKAPLGSGFGVWLNDHEPNPEVRTAIQFSYPKHDVEYYMYYWDTGAVQSGPYATNKTNAHRFIFEENINATTKEVKLQVEAKTVGKEILVGNPYMTHLDFDKFYAANSTKIEPYYKVIDESYSYPTYYKDNPAGSTGTPQLTKTIAPMQAFIVTPKVAINPAVNPLITNSSMMFSAPNNNLRSASSIDGDEGDNYLKVSISDVMKRSKTSILVDKSAKNGFAFNDNMDVKKTIKAGTREYPVIYAITSDGVYSEIKSIASVGEMSIPLGLCYAGTGPLALSFENVKEFADNFLGIEYYIYLEDKLENRLIEITADNSLYCFLKENSDEFTNDRFVLKFTKSGMSIDQPEIEESVSIMALGDLLTIDAKDGEPLGQVIVYDMRGTLVCNKQVADSGFSVLLRSGVYVVRVKDVTTKVIVR